jgi:hypothetical protein
VLLSLLVSAGCLAVGLREVQAALEQSNAAPADAGVRVELAGPQTAPFVWAASEWVVKVQNQSDGGLPFGERVLGGSGYGGVRVQFEVARAGEIIMRLSPNGNMGVACGAKRYDLLEPHAESQLGVVLHGRMELDLAKYYNDEAPDRFFQPVFDQPGTYVVTAVLLWGRKETRSNPVTVVVKAPPEHGLSALTGLKLLARAGICIDIQGMYVENPWRDLERIAEFAAQADGTVYGVQQSIGLASAYARILGGNVASADLVRVGVVVSPDRVKALRGQRPPVEFDIDRTWSKLGHKVDKLTRELASTCR